jgi:hypothetical protein
MATRSEDRPRLKRDLEIGQPHDDANWIELRDPRSGRALRLYPFEYQVARAFDGRPLSDVAGDAGAVADLRLSLDQLADFARHLRELDLLEPEPASPDPDPAPPATPAPRATPAQPARHRASPALYAVAGTVAALGIGLLAILLAASVEPQPITVRTAVALRHPSVYLWFDATSRVELRGANPARARFDLSRGDAAHARRLGFCHAEIGGVGVTCAFATGADDGGAIAIELSPSAVVEAGATVRLARARFDDVFVLPARAAVPAGQRDRVFIATERGRAEPRTVVIGDRTPGEIVVTQGLDPRDAVIVEPPPGLRANAKIRASY